MIKDKELFDRLIGEALEHDFSGWDWSYLSKRRVESPLTWDYHQVVFEASRGVQSMLDMGTGGGEFLSTLQPFPPQMYATECYPPNLSVAKRRLEPLGVKVFGLPNEHALPFEANSLELVINRHEGYLAAEVFRVLKPGSSFITQQVGGRNEIRLNQFLQEKADFIYSYWMLDLAVRDLQKNRFVILSQHEEFPETTFFDIGAVVFYLKIISWQIADFSVERYYDRLAQIHNIIQETGKFVVNSHRFLIEARK